MNSHDTAVEIYIGFRKASFSNSFAVAMVTMAEAESSFRVDVVGDNGHAFGLWQLHGDRIAQIADKIGIKIDSTSTVADQITAVIWELNNTEKYAKHMIESATSAFQAAYNATRYYERPGDHAQWEIRGKRAEYWDNFFKTYSVQF